MTKSCLASGRRTTLQFFSRYLSSPVRDPLHGQWEIAAMVWMGIGVTSLVAFVLMLVFGRRSKPDLGSVSAQWVMTHRVDSH
jgi:hypothetical protein